MLVRYIGKTLPWSLEHGEEYRVNCIEHGQYNITDWDDTETLFDPALFEVISDDMREIVGEFQEGPYKVLRIDGARPANRYNMYEIDGEIYEPVMLYDAINCIAIESTESFIGKSVTFVRFTLSRAVEINEEILQNMKGIHRLRKICPGTRNSPSYVVTLSKIPNETLEGRVDEFEECLRNALIDGEEIECENRCYIIHATGYDITYCLEAYNNHAHVRGHGDNGGPRIELLHRMGYEETHRWMRRNCSESERDFIDRQMLTQKMISTYPNPTDRFHHIVKGIMAAHKMKRPKRDPRIDGEYDPPLLPRKESITDEEKMAFRSILWKLRKRAEAAGRSTTIYDEIAKELEAKD